MARVEGRAGEVWVLRRTDGGAWVCHLPVEPDWEGRGLRPSEPEWVDAASLVEDGEIALQLTREDIRYLLMCLRAKLRKDERSVERGKGAGPSTQARVERGRRINSYLRRFRKGD